MSHMLTRIRREERYGPMLRWWHDVRPYVGATLCATLIVLGVAALHTFELHRAAQDAATTQQARR